MSGGVARASSGNPFLALMIAQAMQSDMSKWCWSVQDGHDPVFPVPPSLAGLLGEKVTLLAAGRTRRAPARVRGRAAHRRPASGDRRATLSSGRPWRPPRTGTWRPSAPGRWSRSPTRCWPRPSTTPPAPAERRRAHRVLAEKLEDPVERARHRSRTITAPDEASRRELEQAADISRGRGAQQLAGELFEGAALATPTGCGYRRRPRPLAPRGGHLHRRRRRAWRRRQPWTRGRRWQSSRSSKPRCWCGESRLAEDICRRPGRSPSRHSGWRREGSEVRAEILQILGVVRRMQGHGRRALRDDPDGGHRGGRGRAFRRPARGR